jgi:LPS sulfotransferase NodH
MRRQAAHWSRDDLTGQPGCSRSSPDLFPATPNQTMRKAIKRALGIGKDSTAADSLASRGDHLLVACFPKSGSTYLSRILEIISGYQRANLAQYYIHNEQDLCRVELVKVYNTNTVTQQHVKGTHNNIERLREFGIKPVILTRNIYDVLLSMHDHFGREDHRIPCVYVHKQYFEMSRDDKLSFLIHNMLPWYFSFLLSWKEASLEMETLWITYEELFADQQATVAKILDYYAMPTTPAVIEQAIVSIKQDNTRLNVGVSGRGADLLETQKQAVQQLARTWQVEPSIMKIIGIEV